MSNVIKANELYTFKVYFWLGGNKSDARVCVASSSWEAENMVLNYLVYSQISAVITSVSLLK